MVASMRHLTSRASSSYFLYEVISAARAFASGALGGSE
ncbi:unnamed protein product, partial [Cuscuta campestris]